MSEKMREWPLAEAKARFSEMLAVAEKNGPQCVTKRGKPVAVLAPFGLFERLTGRKPERSAIDWLLAPEARSDALSLPDRAAYRWRKAPKV